jgi:nucleotide-binding universal stress UspA family protein
MDHALAVVRREAAARAVVREAAELAAGVGARLTLLAVTSEEDYEHRQQSYEESGATAAYTIDQAEEAAEYKAVETADEVLADLDVEYEVTGIVGDPAESVLAVAESRDVDHVFLSGRRRSPAGKALFGDVTQDVLLEFDGFVTVRLARDDD